MLRDITFGKYYNTQSVIHSLDGRINFLRFTIFLASVIIIKNPWLLVFAAVFLFTVVLLSKIPLSYIFKGVWGVRYYIILCLILSLVSDFSRKGVINALFLSIKLFLTVTSASLFTLTTSIEHISDTFEWVLSPLRIFNVPVRDVAVMLSIALRFIPVLSTEAEHIIQAQKARGAQLGKGSLVRRAKNVMPLIIPIFVSAVRRASDLADALKARAYGAYDSRTRLNPLKFKRRDLFALIAVLVYFSLILWGNRYGR